MLKQYNINQSPLYQILGRNQLEKCLNIKLVKLDILLKDDSYRSWINEEGRTLQQPLGWLKAVHERVAIYLSKIETPDYVYHKKGRSHVKNAHEHVGHHSIVKTDIRGYFPRTSRQMIKAMFVNQFKCANDIAGILADICSYNKSHLPTGSAISGYIAFFANQKLFNAVNELAVSKGCSFTLYVDDLTISGTEATKLLLNEVRGLIKSAGRQSKDSKSKVFTPLFAKTVTGVVIKGNECLLPNRRHKAIADSRSAIASSLNDVEKAAMLRSLKGRLNAAKQILDVNNGVDVSYPNLIYS